MKQWDMAQKINDERVRFFIGDVWIKSDYIEP